MTEELADQVSRLSLDNVEFIGRLSEDELPKLFSTMDIYVSAAETDGTSVTLLQAMAMQVPVVVSDSQGNVALLLSGADHPELGRLFELNSPAALARQVQETVQNPENTAVQVKAGRAYVLREADWAANIKRLGDLITAVSRA
jgi:glycosyltransferase involved in cell wall biosynthesis